MKKCLLLLFISLVTTAAYSQGSAAGEAFDFSLVKGKKDVLVAYSGKTHGFPFKVEADSVRPYGEPGWFYVNGLLVQSSIIEIPDKFYQDNLSVQRQAEILQAYVEYELAYFKNELNINFKELVVKHASFDGVPMVVWVFNTSKIKGKVKKQLYLSSICFNQTHSLNIPLMEGQDPKEALRLMITMAKTRKQYNHALDLQTLTAGLD